MIFSASIPAANAAAALAALHVIRDEPQMAERVIQIGARVKRELGAMGFNVGESVTPIVPVIIGDDEKTFLTWKTLFENGVFVNPVIHRQFRMHATAAYQLYGLAYDAQIDRCWRYSTVGKQVGII